MLWDHGLAQHYSSICIKILMPDINFMSIFTIISETFTSRACNTAVTSLGIIIVLVRNVPAGDVGVRCKQRSS